MWRSHCCGRKEALFSVSKGRNGLSAGVPFLCEECDSSARWIAESWGRAQAPTVDVMSQTSTLVFVFLAGMFVWLLHVVVYPASAPAHGCLFLALSSDPPPPLALSLFLWMSAVSDGSQEGPAEFGEHLQATRQCKFKGGIHQFWSFI